MIPNPIEIALIIGMNGKGRTPMQYTIFFYGKNAGSVERIHPRKNGIQWRASMGGIGGYGKTKEDAVLDAIKKQMVVYDNNKTDLFDDDPEIKDYFDQCEKETGEKRDDYTY